MKDVSLSIEKLCLKWDFFQFTTLNYCKISMIKLRLLRLLIKRKFNKVICSPKISQERNTFTIRWDWFFLMSCFVRPTDILCKGKKETKWGGFLFRNYLYLVNGDCSFEEW